MLISHKGNNNTIQVYSVTVMTHVKALQAGKSSQGTSEPITPVLVPAAVIVTLVNFSSSISLRLRVMIGYYGDATKNVFPGTGSSLPPSGGGGGDIRTDPF